jgi:RecT family
MNDKINSEALDTSPHNSNSAVYCPPEILHKKLEQLSKTLVIEVYELLFWIQKYSLLKTSILLRLIHLATTYRLDPLIGEVTLWFDAKQQAHPSITIDGWIKIINTHPAFTGIEFEEITSSENTSAQSMQCTIHRSDRAIPIRVQEYLDEVKSDHPLWKSMPRRMLRHRVLQQCARLAFGISTPEFLASECIESTEYNESKSPNGNQAERDLHFAQSKSTADKTTLTQRESRTEQLKIKLLNERPQMQT